MEKLSVVCILTASLTLLAIGAGCSQGRVTQSKSGEITQTEAASNQTNSQNTGSQVAVVQPETEVPVQLDRADEDAALSRQRVMSASSSKVEQQTAATLDLGVIQYEPIRMHLPTNNTEKYQEIVANPVVRVSDEPTSTFSIDVDTGAYSNTRRFLKSGQLPPVDAVRVEELLNYFSYEYPGPESSQVPFSIHTELSSSPWNSGTRLLHIGLKGYDIDSDERPPANLVFLIDVSGSMQSDDKLGLLKSSIQMLSTELSAKDSVSIVVYAGASGVVLEPTSGNEQGKIRAALRSLSAGGSTNGEAGILLAYDMAEKSMTKDTINRIVLATDGDFNVGISDIKKLKRLIERKRESGIALTTLGFGTGNYNDHLMEQLADVGNGAYAYIDTLSEARKVLSDELTSTLLTIAKDVKIQIEFNPARVTEYRLIGYVNRRLNNEDFANDNVDAGEIGAGHTVTALYEIALRGENGEWRTESRYQNEVVNSELDEEIAEIRLRYKRPDEAKSQLIKQVIKHDGLIADINRTSDNYRFSAAVAGFGQLLRNSKYLVDFSYNDSAALAKGARGEDSFGYRSEFLQLINLAESIDKQNRIVIGSSQ